MLQLHPALIVFFFFSSRSSRRNMLHFTISQHKVTSANSSLSIHRRRWFEVRRRDAMTSLDDLIDNFHANRFVWGQFRESPPESDSEKKIRRNPRPVGFSNLRERERAAVVAEPVLADVTIVPSGSWAKSTRVVGFSNLKGSWGCRTRPG